MAVTGLSVPIIGVLVILSVLYLLAKPWFSPLNRISGPFAARYTRLWLLKGVWDGTFPWTNVKLHKKYGPVVRIAPNEYSIDDPAAVKIIYGAGSTFPKSRWYEASERPSTRVSSLFAEPDPHKHAAERRKIASVYTMSNLIQFEPFVEDCTAILKTRLREFAESGIAFDVSHWVQCYAFDVIGKITVSDRFGFLDRGEDIQDIMSSLEEYLNYTARVGIFPEWHKTVYAWKMRSQKVSGVRKVAEFALSRVATKFEKAAIGEDVADNPGAPVDMITKLLRAQKNNPEKLSSEDVGKCAMANIGAGSDTTSISLSAVIFNLLKEPRTLAALRAEIRDFAARGLISDPIKYAETQKMPYLQAVIKEALRIHPATGLILGRVVPPGGATLAGRFFPEGTVVGINSWVAHRNTDVFGADADVFRPERWLEDPVLTKRREAYFMAFGHGARTCIGKNISLMEMSKMLPEILKEFDFVPDTASGKPEWQTENVWFVKPKKFMCKVRQTGA